MAIINITFLHHLTKKINTVNAPFILFFLPGEDCSYGNV